MTRTSAPQTRERHEEHAESLRGTLASVLVLGTFILVSWVAVFLLFLARR